MEAYLLDWANLLLRWAHMIAGIAWIGASFYFVMLDNSLSPPKKEEDKKRGVFGEIWAVHGGGFYVSQKFLAGPLGEPLSDNLHWSKWEAYSTWITGLGMLALIYWIGASTNLVDKRVLALSPAVAIGISCAVLVLGWLVYDGLCRLFDGKEKVLGLVLVVFVMAVNYGLHQVFSAKGAYLHVGAMLGTMMAANVFFHIIPGQKKMVAQIRAGEPVDPRPGVVGKQRSIHNTYFTLPVLFIMISGHYPLTYSHPHGWIILGVIMFAGVLIRQFFVLRHRGQVKWWLPITGVALLLSLIVWLAPKTPEITGSAEKVSFKQINTIMEQRCTACHAAKPTYQGFNQPPKGVLLQTPDQIAQHAVKIAETVASGYMPLGNVTNLTEDEKRLVALWFSQGAPTQD